jgi:hypothetical protein
VTAVTREQQRPPKLFIVNECAAIAADGGMELVARSVLDVAVEHVSSYEACLANTVEELIAALAGTAGETDQASRGGERGGNEQAGSHGESIRPC